MSTFLVIIPTSGHHVESNALFERGLSRLRAMSGGANVTTYREQGCLVASIAGIGGRGGGIEIDESSGSYIVNAGIWFQRGVNGIKSPRRALQTFLSQGAKALANELEGFFGLVIGNAKTKETTVITDLLGNCHVFERHLTSGVVISNSSLLLANLDSCTVDPLSLRYLVAAGAIYDESRSLFREVTKFAAAQIYRYDPAGKAQAEVYWRVADLKPGRLEGNQAADALWEELTAAMRRIAAAYPRIVCDVTGGYDTRSMLAACIGASVDISTTVTGTDDNIDVVIGLQLAAMTGRPTIRFDRLPVPTRTDLEALTWLTDGEADVVDYSRVASVHKQLMTQFDISLSGAIFELSRSHWWELLSTLGSDSSSLDGAMIARRRLIAEPFDASLFGSDPTEELVQNASATIRRAIHGMDGMPMATQMNVAYMQTRLLRWGGRLTSTTNRIWPSLSPSLLRPVLETMLTVEPRTRVRNHLVRLMLARHQPQLANIPLDRGHPAIPFRLSAAHRFWPVIPMYAKRAMHKAYRMATSRPLVPASDGASNNAFLVADEEITDILNPQRMKLADHLDTVALRRFLDASKRPGFAYEEQWRCLLSAELALRAAAQNA
jgi:hypothetical protein